MENEFKVDYRKGIELIQQNKYRAAKGLQKLQSLDQMFEEMKAVENIRDKIEPTFAFLYPGLYSDSDDD
jgi:hypothetical protein